MSQEVEKGKRFKDSTIQYLPCLDWEKTLVQDHDRPALEDCFELPGFRYNPKDRPIFSN